MVHAPPSVNVLKTRSQSAAVNEKFVVKNPLLAPVKTWNPTKKVLLSKSMIAVISNATVGHQGNKSLAMSQISVTSGCFMQNCQRTYEVSIGVRTLQLAM